MTDERLLITSWIIDEKSPEPGVNLCDEFETRNVQGVVFVPLPLQAVSIEEGVTYRGPLIPVG